MTTQSAISFLDTGHSAKPKFSELECSEAAVGDLTQPATTSRSGFYGRRYQQTHNGQSEFETVDQYYTNEMSRGFDGKCRLTDVQRPVEA